MCSLFVMYFCNYYTEKNIDLKLRKSILISRLSNGIVQILNRYIQAWPGVPWHTKILADQLTLFQLEGWQIIQAWIYLLRICTIPYDNLEMRILFRSFRSIFFSVYQLKVHDKQTTHIQYSCYIQLVIVVRPFEIKKILGKRDFFL